MGKLRENWNIVLAKVGFQMVLTDVSTNLNEFASFLLCFSSHQLNSLTHLTVIQSKTELLDLSLHVKECTILQP